MPTATKAQQPDDGSGQKAAAPDPRDEKIAELERQLAEAQRPSGFVPSAGQATVRLKVEAPHSELHYAGHVVGTEFTEVPANIAAALMAGAADAGVTTTQDQES
jgi:hypothetical protein